MTILDERLLDRVRRRDPEALESFFDSFVDRVHTYVFTMVRGDEAVDDLVQMAFLAMHRAIDRLDPARDPSGWVFTIATNTVRDWWRSRDYRWRGRRVDLEQVEREVVDREDAIDIRMIRGEEESLVREALAMLSMPDQEIVWLRVYEEFPAPEVATILGITPEAVRQRHSRAVQRLGRIYRQFTESKQGEAAND